MGYAVSTTLVVCMSAGLAALHVIRNVRPNPQVIGNLLSELRSFLAQLVCDMRVVSCEEVVMQTACKYYICCAALWA